MLTMAICRLTFFHTILSFGHYVSTMCCIYWMHYCYCSQYNDCTLVGHPSPVQSRWATHTITHTWKASHKNTYTSYQIFITFLYLMIYLQQDTHSALTWERQLGGSHIRAWSQVHHLYPSPTDYSGSIVVHALREAIAGGNTCRFCIRGSEETGRVIVVTLWIFPSGPQQLHLISLIVWSVKQIGMYKSL